MEAIRDEKTLQELSALCVRKNLTKMVKEHKKYPYLLRGVKIERVNQVWSTDITYIKLSSGFAYLTAVIDWYSRKVLSWRLSNTLDNSFCKSAVKEALCIYGNPEIFNSDQDSQYRDLSRKLCKGGLVFIREFSI